MTVNLQKYQYTDIIMTDAEVFVKDHYDRFKSWMIWAAPGGLAQIDLAANDAGYYKNIEPEVAQLIARKAPAQSLTFLNVGDGRRLCITDAFKIIEMMEAAHGKV